jgi:hypothetical protein
MQLIVRHFCNFFFIVTFLRLTYTAVSRLQNTGQNHTSVITAEPFENVVKLKYLRTTVTSQNYIHEHIIFRGYLLLFSVEFFHLTFSFLKT